MAVRRRFVYIRSRRFAFPQLAASHCYVYRSQCTYRVISVIVTSISVFIRYWQVYGELCSGKPIGRFNSRASSPSHISPFRLPVLTDFSSRTQPSFEWSPGDSVLNYVTTSGYEYYPVIVLLSILFVTVLYNTDVCLELITTSEIFRSFS